MAEMPKPIVPLVIGTTACPLRFTGRPLLVAVRALTHHAAALGGEGTPAIVAEDFDRIAAVRTRFPVPRKGRFDGIWPRTFRYGQRYYRKNGGGAVLPT